MPSDQQLGALPLFLEPWLQNKNPIWLGTTVTVARNIEQFVFPHVLKTDQQKQLIKLLSSSLTRHPSFAGGVLKRGDECLPVDKEYLIEHFFLPINQIQAFAGSSFLLNQSGSLLSIFNLENHLMLYGIGRDGDLESLYRNLVSCEEAVQKDLGYAFSNRFGYLTSNPEIAGCGLKARALLQLSALIHTKELEPLLESETKEGILASPIFKDKSDWTLDLISIENKFCLGVTEEVILSSVKMFAEKLIEKEKKKREEILSQNSHELKDKVSRAFAVLKHSYQIDAKEAMNALSLIKLGVTLNWVQGISLDLLNELFFVIRRAHFLKMSKQNYTPEALLHERAIYLQDKLKNLKLMTF